MAEWSKALVLGTSLFGDVGSNPTPDMIFISFLVQRVKRIAFHTSNDFVLHSCVPICLTISPDTRSLAPRGSAE